MKKYVAVLCGGQSAEHAISLLSASNVVRELDRSKFEVLVFYIALDSSWWLIDEAILLSISTETKTLSLLNAKQLSIIPNSLGRVFYNMADQKEILVDVVFPVLHGINGEDGTIQGLLSVLNLAYVGCDTLSAAACMEKHVTKELVRAAGVPVLDWVSFNENEKLSYEEVTDKLQTSTVFVKTVYSGSSLGVYKVSDEEQYNLAVAEAFSLDNYLIVEPAVENPRELEISVLGNANPQCSGPGEVIVYDDFYTYESKYFNPESSATESPAKVSHELSKHLKYLALKSFKALRCIGMARIDFLVVGDDIYLNEINTIPGFTNISMYPQNWQSEGLEYPALLTCLIELALEQRRVVDKRYQSMQAWVSAKHEKNNDK